MPFGSGVALGILGSGTKLGGFDCPRPDGGAGVVGFDGPGPGGAAGPGPGQSGHNGGDSSSSGSHIPSP